MNAPARATDPPRRRISAAQQGQTASDPRFLAPGLDPASPYFSRLSARSALYTDLAVLLDAAETPLGVNGFRRLVVDENALARSSEAARSKLWQELKSRYLLDGQHPLFTDFWQQWSRSSGDAERALVAYCMLALNDRLVADLGTEFLYPRLRRAPAALRVDDVLTFLRHARQSHPEVRDWSEKTTIAVAQKYCASIRDFGLASGTSRKQTIRPALYGAPMRLLIRALRLAGTLDIALLEAPVFKPPDTSRPSKTPAASIRPQASKAVVSGGSPARPMPSKHASSVTRPWYRSPAISASPRTPPPTHRMPCPRSARSAMSCAPRWYGIWSGRF